MQMQLIPNSGICSIVRFGRSVVAGLMGIAMASSAGVSLAVAHEKLNIVATGA
jgi:hypothetical protein